MNKSIGEITEKTKKRISRIKRRIDRKILWPLISPLYVDYDPDYRNSIFLAGVEKSGTTWVSDIIINYKHEYRYVYEPFWPQRVDICREFRLYQYLRPENRDSYFIEATEAILSGRIRNKWVDQYHRRFIANKRLIKDVCSNLLLKWMHSNFPGLPIILLLRHPCAVARAQLRREFWDPDLREEYLVQEALMEDFLNPFKEEIEKAQTRFEKFIFRWCIQNYVPLKQFKRGEIYLAFYESFCEKPKSEIDRLFSFLGTNYDEAIFANLKKPSSRVRPDSAIITGDSLIDSWREHITDERIQRAVEILHLFGLDRIYAHDSVPNVAGAYNMMEDN